MKIGLVSDTHIPDSLVTLPPRLVERLDGVDVILHAGDLVCLDVVDALQSIAETIIVHGNADRPEVVRRLPRKELVSLSGRRIGLIHGHQKPEIQRQYLKSDPDYDSPEMGMFWKYLVGELPDAEVIVFGHLHVPVVKPWGGRLFVNPGSVAPHRGRQTFATLELGPSKTDVTIVEL